MAVDMNKLVNLDRLKEFQTSENASTASEFSTSKSYAAGAYVYYKGKLYKFKSAHAAGAWTTTDVEEAKLADDVSDLKESITLFADTPDRTGYRFPEWEEGVINTETGADATSTKFRIRTTNYLKTPITISVDSGVQYLLVFYNDNKQYISGMSTWKADPLYYATAQNATCVRITVRYAHDSRTDIFTLASKVHIEYYEPNAIDQIIDSGLKTFDQFHHDQGWILDTNKWGNRNSDPSKRKWQHLAIPVNANDLIEFQFTTNAGFIAFLKTYQTPVSDGTPDFSAVTGYTTKINTVVNTPYCFTVPADATYVVIPIQYNGPSIDYTYFKINGYDYANPARDSIAKTTQSSRPRWFALGDSLTEGYTSADGQLSDVTQYNYVYYVAKYNNYIATNYGVGGAGYNHVATVGDLKNARDHVDTIDFINCDLCTLAYGINDWHYDCAIGTVNDDPSTGGTMASNMKYCIEKILSDNPFCKIIVLLPMNNSAFGTGNTKANNWGLGATFTTSGTLQHVIDVQIAICEYYGIEYIDQSKTSVVNRENIQTLLSDGTHPVASAYPIIGANLARQIKFA